MILSGCSDKEKVIITDIKQLHDKEFGIPTGTVADTVSYTHLTLPTNREV